MTPTVNDLEASRTSSSYHKVLSALLDHEHVFHSPPSSPHKPLIPQTAPLLLSPPNNRLPSPLHPVLETTLHILNADLPSAHFLCRHAEVAPAWESMYAHGILHRIEGDIDNARAWYDDVEGKEVFEYVWGAAERPEAARGDAGWKGFLDRVERWRDRVKGRRGERKEDVLDGGEVGDWEEEERLLRETSLWEIRRFLEYCEMRFGTGAVEDASTEFCGKVESGNEELAKQAEGMVTGGEGWRQF